MGIDLLLHSGIAVNNFYSRKDTSTSTSSARGGGKRCWISQEIKNNKIKRTQTQMMNFNDTIKMYNTLTLAMLQCA